jgi:hypothetical protein
MKKIIITSLLIFLAIFSTVRAQGFIRESDCLKHDTNIIREVSETEYLVCMQYKNTNYVRFVMTGENNSINQELTLYDYRIHVSDMEIFHDTAYFCGYYCDGQDTLAYFGNFDIASFPASQVNLYVDPVLHSFTKMDCYSTYSQALHLELIGIDKSGIYAIVDCKKNGTAFTRNICYISDNHNILDDVAVIRDYTVFSGRNTVNMTGFLYYLKKETMAYPFLPNTVIRHSPNLQLVGDRILLDHYVDNKFGLITTDGCVLFAAYYDCFNRYFTSVHTGYQNVFRFVDIKFNKGDGALHVLMRDRNACNSVVFELAPNDFVTRCAGRLYRNHTLHSLEYLQTYPNHFVISGQRDCGDAFRLVGYTARDTQSCTENIILDQIAINGEDNIEIISLLQEISVVRSVIVDKNVYSNPITTICKTK